MKFFRSIKNKNIENFFLVFLLISTLFFIPIYSVLATLSCSITTAGACGGTVLLRMSGSDNAHAELPTQSTPAYSNNVVCCSGVTGLGNSCGASNMQIFAKLSGVTNAHVEKNTESNYANNACISSSYAGDEITVGYQSSNCTGYDTTLFSMAKTPTNSQVGSPSSYANKVCAKIFTQSITVSITDNSIGFGVLSFSNLRYATGDGTGNSSETEAHKISVNTNAPSGYTVYIKGGTLSDGVNDITPIGGVNQTPTVGTKAFGVRGVASGGVGTVVSPYDGSGFAYDADETTSSPIGTAASGNGVTTDYSIRAVATIDDLLNYGNYSTNLTYIVVPNF